MKKEEASVKRLLKWVLVAGGVIVGGILLLAIIVSFFDESESEVSESPIILTGEEFQSMTKEEFETWLRSNEQNSEEAIQRALSDFEANKAAQRRWTNRMDHWENLDAFDRAVSKIQEDRVVDATEASYICTVAPQWAEQMQAAQAYIQDYRQHDPELVTKTPSLHRLEGDASAKSEFVADLIANCPNEL